VGPSSRGEEHGSSRPRRVSGSSPRYGIVVESLSCIVLLGRDCRHNVKFGVDVTDKDREGIERIDVNSKVSGGTGPRNFILPHEGNIIHVHHGNETVAEIFAILVRFLSDSDSSRVNMNSYLNVREIFLEKRWGRRPSTPSIAGGWHCRAEVPTDSCQTCDVPRHYLHTIGIQYHKSRAALTRNDVATSVEIQTTRAGAHFPEQLE
jgi:hypothetical protein